MTKKQQLQHKQTDETNKRTKDIINSNDNYKNRKDYGDHRDRQTDRRS